MLNFAPIGSIVRIHEAKFLVVAHRMARDEQNIGMCYVLVPYPLGFVNASSLSLTPVRKIEEVVSQGYCSNTGIEYLENLTALANESEGIGYDDYADAVLSFSNYLKEESKDE